VSPQLDLSGLKEHARRVYAPGHPYRLAVEALPESVSDEAYVAQLRILIPLARVREER
jgi:hypothetical protein